MSPLILLKKYWKPLAVVLGILALLGGVYFKGYRNGKETVYAEWTQAEKQRADAIEADRQGRQNKADAIDEDTNKIIQDLSIKNAAMQRELDDERIKPDYDCVVPLSGVQLYNKAVSAKPH